MSSHDDPTEVAKARLHRDQQGRRAVAEQARVRALSGSRLARAALADDWSAVKADPRHVVRGPELGNVFGVAPMGGQPFGGAA